MDVKIRDFMTGNVKDTKALCFYLVNKLDKRYAYEELSPGRLRDQSQELVEIAHQNHETEKFVVALCQYWLEDLSYSAEVLVHTGMADLLCQASQILWERDRTWGKPGFELLTKVVPAFNDIWKPEHCARVVFDPPQGIDDFIPHLTRCEALFNQVNECTQERRWREAGDSLSQLHALLPGYGDFPWQSDKAADFIKLQKIREAASSGVLYEESLPQGKMFPYALFRDMKKAITPSSSMDEVQTELRQLTDIPASSRAALESLGKSEEDRLAVDMYLYPNCPDDAIARSIEQTFLESGCIPTPAEIKSQYPAEAGSLLVILGLLDEAEAFWVEAQRESPLNGQYAHNLGLLYLGRSQNSDTSSLQNWQRAIAQWAISLSDTTYWVRWGRERFKAYGRSFVFATISKLTSSVPAALLKLIENTRWPGEAAEKAQMVAALQRDLHVEFTAVHLMQAIGNLPLPSGRLAQFGPLWMNYFGAEVDARTTVSQFLRDVRPVDIQPNALMEGLSTEEVLQQLRWLFSELKSAASQLEADPRLALESLTRRSAVPSWENNPAYELLPDNVSRFAEDATQLEFYARLRLLAKLVAQTTDMSTEAFQGEWQALVNLIDASTAKESLQVRLRKFLEDASALTESGAGRLNATITLMEAYLTIADETPLRNRLADLLRYRAVYRQEQADIPGAEADLQRALKYDPYDWESRALLASLWIGLIIGFSDRYLALEYLRRAKSLILEGQEKNPGYDFDALLQEIEKGIKRFTNPDRGHAIFAAQEEEEGPLEVELVPQNSDEEEISVDEESPSEMLKLYRQAMQEKLSGRLSEALHTLAEALKINPDDLDLQSMAAETVTALAARQADQRKAAEARKLIAEWMPRLPQYQERLERRKAFFSVWPTLKGWLGELPYHTREFEYIEVPIQGQKTTTIGILARPEKEDLRLSVALPIIPASNEELVLSNLLQATRWSPIVKAACPRKLDFVLMGQVPFEMLDARWFLLLLLELFHYADLAHPELLELDALQNRFRENHQQLTQDFKTSEFLSASSSAVERYCTSHSLGFVRTTEARFEIGAFSNVVMDASKDNVRFSTILNDINLVDGPNSLARLRKCAELNHSLQWCKLTLNETRQIVLSLELPYVEGELTDQVFSQLERTWREVRKELAEAGPA